MSFIKKNYPYKNQQNTHLNKQKLDKIAVDFTRGRVLPQLGILISYLYRKSVSGNCRHSPLTTVNDDLVRILTLQQVASTQYCILVMTRLIRNIDCFFWISF